MKAPWKSHFWIAAVAGPAVSGVLFALNFAMNPDHHPALSNVLFTAQYPGWIAAAFLLPGSFESTNTANFIGIAAPVNAALYATVIFALLRLRALR